MRTESNKSYSTQPTSSYSKSEKPKSYSENSKDNSNKDIKPEVEYQGITFSITHNMNNKMTTLGMGMNGVSASISADLF